MRARFLNQAIAWYAFAACALFAAGCSGGGSSSAPPVSAPPTAAATAPVTFSISVGSAPAAVRAKRRPAYLSTATKSVAITPIALGSVTQPTIIEIAQGAANCSGSGAALTCTGTVSAPVGQTSFNVVTYAGAAAGGAVLSSGTITVQVATSSNSVTISNKQSLTLNAVPARFTLSTTPLFIAIGTPSTVRVSATVYDAAGAIIIGSGSFTTPIVLETIVPSGTPDTVLTGTIGTSVAACTYPTPTGDTCYSVATIDGPGAPVTLSYNGASVSTTSFLLVGELPGQPYSVTTIAVKASSGACVGSPITVCPGSIQFADPASSPVPITATEKGVTSFQANATDCVNADVATIGGHSVAFGTSFTIDPIQLNPSAAKCTITVSDAANNSTTINVALLSTVVPTPTPSPTPTMSPTPTPAPSGPITIAPSSTLEFTSSTAAAQTITASQPGFSSFSIDQTACAGVATVSPASGTSFSVTPVAALTQGGTCVFDVKDSAGNSSPVTVYVDGTIFHIH